MSDFRVVLTESAEQDLEELVDYLLQDGSSAAAARLLQQVRGKIASLESFPERGAHPKELAELGILVFRQLNFGPYRMIYRVQGKTVYLTLIADGGRDMIALLQRRLLSV